MTRYELSWVLDRFDTYIARKSKKGFLVKCIFYLAGGLATLFSSCALKICLSASGSIPGFLGEPKMVCVFPDPVGPIATRRPLFPPKKSSTSGFITCTKISSCKEESSRQQKYEIVPEMRCGGF